MSELSSRFFDFLVFFSWASSLFMDITLISWDLWSILDVLELINTWATLMNLIYGYMCCVYASEAAIHCAFCSCKQNSDVGICKALCSCSVNVFGIFCWQCEFWHNPMFKDASVERCEEVQQECWAGRLRGILSRNVEHCVDTW